MFKAVMFDLDGTIADTLDDLLFAMNAMLSNFGYPRRSRDEISSFLGSGQKVFVTKSLPEYARDEENIKKCCDFYEKFYSENLVIATAPFDGIPELLGKLKANGVRIVILSNKNQEHVSKIVDRLFESALFDVVMGAGEFKHKPDPEAPLYIAEKLGVYPNECAFVGDSEIDIKTAKNAGMYGVGVAWGFREKNELVSVGADAIAENAAELAEILGI